MKGLGGFVEQTENPNKSTLFTPLLDICCHATIRWLTVQNLSVLAKERTKNFRKRYEIVDSRHCGGCKHLY